MRVRCVQWVLFPLSLGVVPIGFSVFTGLTFGGFLGGSAWASSQLRGSLPLEEEGEALGSYSYSSDSMESTPSGRVFTPISSQNFKRKAASALFFGLGGAVVGLSTLSFYGDPALHVDNVYLGFLSGLLIGLFQVGRSSSSLDDIYSNGFVFPQAPRDRRMEVQVPLVMYSY